MAGSAVLTPRDASCLPSRTGPSNLCPYWAGSVCLPLGLDTFAISAALRLHSAKQVAIDVLRPARKPLHPLALARQTS
jgi:hypothetical protein